MTLRLALRGLVRARGRTALAAAALAFSVAALVVALALIEGIFVRMAGGAARRLAGEATVLPAREGETLERADELLRSVRAVPGVEGASARLRAPALLTAGDRRGAGEVLGVDPVDEVTVSERELLLVSGEWLRGDGSDGALLGKDLARVLGAGPGTRITLELRAADGLPAALSLRVAGVVATHDSRRDARLVVTGIEGLRAALAAPGSAHEIGLALAHPEAAEEEAARIGAALGPASEARVVPWQRRLPALAAAVAFARASSWWLAALLQGAAGLVVLMVLLVSFHERRREHALCLALGMSPRVLGGAILAEALLLGAAGALVGAGAGSATARLLAARGLDLGWILGGPVGYAGGVIEPVLRAVPAWWQVARAAASALLVAALAGTVAARRLRGVSPTAVLAGRELR